MYAIRYEKIPCALLSVLVCSGKKLHVDFRYELTMALVTSNVVSSSCRLAALAIAQMIANHRVGFGKSCLKTQEFIVDLLSP